VTADGSEIYKSAVQGVTSSACAYLVLAWKGQGKQRKNLSWQPKFIWWQAKYHAEN